MVETMVIVVTRVEWLCSSNGSKTSSKSKIVINTRDQDGVCSVRT